MMKHIELRDQIGQEFGRKIGLHELKSLIAVEKGRRR